MIVVSSPLLTLVFFCFSDICFFAWSLLTLHIDPVVISVIVLKHMTWTYNKYNDTSIETFTGIKINISTQLGRKR